jgi:protein gp37
MSDFFHPAADEWRDDAWETIRACHRLDWLILTKRPELIEDRLPKDWNDGYPNVWLGVTAGCRDSLGRVDVLSKIPAVIRFISAEPLLEQLNLDHYLRKIDWVITGCERAKKGKRRLMELDWVRDIDLQCLTAGVPHFFKQYYEDDTGVPKEDGVLDGVKRQDWPNVLIGA